jgi:SAM-dependent methyltransferase
MTTPGTTIDYVGSELDLFADAVNWKTYWAKALRPFIGGDGIEVGAGIGTSTPYLLQGRPRTWLCLEPDPALAARIDARVASRELPAICRTQVGIVADLPRAPQADTITYIDVLEHIEHDEAEIDEAAARLRPGGRIVILAPAFNLVFSPFDQAVGHFRRYSRRDESRLTRPGLHLEKSFYLDGVGLTLSLCNRMVLKSDMPTRHQIGFWDKYVIPISRITDAVTAPFFGRTIIMVLQKS